jgi:uncharacterized protein
MRRSLLHIVLMLNLPLHAARFDCGLDPPPGRDQGRLVWDHAGWLEHDEADRLNARLVSFARETSNQLLVLIVDTLCGLPESDLAFEVGERWGIGQQRFDNGIVLLVKPNGPPGQRKVFIAVGYGLEGAIPDLRAKQVVEGIILPGFRRGDPFGALDAATTTLMAMAKGEYNEAMQPAKPPVWPVLLVFALVGAVIFLSWRNRVSNYASTNRVDWWTAMWLLSRMDSRTGRWHRAGGGWSGGGGGGFGGFGGGSFGGGGAGGSW